MLVNVKLNVSGRRDYLSRLHTLLVFLILKGTADEVGNIGILVLWRDYEKLYLCSFTLFA